jgi:hypothetical protein
MKTATAKALAGTLCALLVLFFILILCTSSSPRHALLQGAQGSFHRNAMARVPVRRLWAG